MPNCATDFAYANEEECYIKKEVSCGVLIKPVTSDRIFTVGPVDFAQEQEFSEDGQLRAGASKRSSIKGKKNPGEWNNQTYVKPSGSLGVAPEHDVLFECAMGSKATNVGTSIVYTLANQLDSFSTWVKKGHTVYALRGCTVEGGEFNVAGDSIAEINWSGKYMEQGWAGTIIATGSYSGAEAIITLPSGGAQRFTTGMYVNVGADDNGGDGYQITVNYTNDTLAISPVIQANPGSTPEITPWFPASGAEVGVPVHGKLGLVTINGADSVILKAGVTLTNNLKYYIDEKNNVFTAERFGRPGLRDVEGTLE